MTSSYSITNVVGGSRSNTTRSSRPVHPFAALDKLPANFRIEDRGAEGVFLIETYSKWSGTDGKSLSRPDVRMSRVDSMEDSKIRRAGGQPWYVRFLAAK